MMGDWLILQSMKVLVVQEVEKSYGDRQILRGCTTTVDQGERLGVVGVNGAGKSTFLRLISGTEAPDSGRLQCTGSVAMLDQNPRLSGSTVEEAVREASAWHQQLLDDYQHGHPILDSHRVELLAEGLYHPDGQILDEVYER